MSRFEEFEELAKQKVQSLAKKTLKEYREAALQDGVDFLEQTKLDLDRWTKALAKKQLSAKDFAWLVQSKKDLAQLEALKQVGLARIKLDRFRNSLLDVIVDAALGTFL